MTEKQGGSDVRANTTRAEPTGVDDAWGREFRLTGHKWFCSAPMSDAFLVLAQAPGGLSCFFVPRVLPDGTRNVFRIQRLKDKLGNRSNASSEIELDGTVGVARRRRGTRRRDDRADGHAHPARLRDRHRPRACASRSPRRPGTCGTAARSARCSSTSPRWRRSSPTSRSSPRRRRSRRCGSRAPTTTTPDRMPEQAFRRLATAVVEVLGVQARPGPRRTRRSSASAATATPRRSRSPAAIASSRCSRSGRARATSSRSTCCACSRASPRRSRRSSTSSARRPASTRRSTSRSPRRGRS